MTVISAEIQEVFEAIANDGYESSVELAKSFLLMKPLSQGDPLVALSCSEDGDDKSIYICWLDFGVSLDIELPPRRLSIHLWKNLLSDEMSNEMSDEMSEISNSHQTHHYFDVSDPQQITNCKQLMIAWASAYPEVGLYGFIPLSKLV